MSQRTRLQAGFLAVAALTLLLCLLPAFTAPPAAMAWEYGEFGAQLDHTVAPSAYRTWWESAERVVQAPTLDELCTKLGGRSTHDRTTDVLNLLGKDGWELVTHATSISTLIDSSRASSGLNGSADSFQTHGGPAVETDKWTLRRSLRE